MNQITMKTAERQWYSPVSTFSTPSEERLAGHPEKGGSVWEDFIFPNTLETDSQYISHLTLNIT
jgi:hypothetical protein